MYMSRLAAMKEHAFLQALYEVGFPVPKPVSSNRHTVLMALVDAFPLRQIAKVPDPANLYGQLIELILRLAKFGLIHGDFNEFNILIEEHEVGSSRKPQTKPLLPEMQPEQKTPAEEQEQNKSLEDAQVGGPDEDSERDIQLIPIIIDFPQSVSIDHANAEFYFDRDVACVKRFFSRRFHFTSDEPGPFFADAIKDAGKKSGVRRLDVEVEASGFSRKMAKELEKYMKEVGVDGDGAETVRGEREEENDEEGEEAINELEEDAPAPDSAVQGTDASQPAVSPIIDGMTVLELSEAAAAIPNFPVDPNREEAYSIAGSMRSVRSRNPTTIAKASRGWAI
jgi:RIO kinase 2